MPSDMSELVEIVEPLVMVAVPPLPGDEENPPSDMLLAEPAVSVVCEKEVKEIVVMGAVVLVPDEPLGLAAAPLPMMNCMSVPGMLMSVVAAIKLEMDWPPPPPID